MVAQLQNNVDDANTPAHIYAGAKSEMCILDAKYEKVNLPANIDSISTIDQYKKALLLRTMKKNEHLFDKTLGNFDCEPAKLPTNHGQDTPYHAPRAFLVPHFHRNRSKKELDRLVLIVVQTER